jgi:small-conductance mechanosensitive channel
MHKYVTDLLEKWNLHPLAWNLIIIVFCILTGLLIRLLMAIFTRKKQSALKDIDPSSQNEFVFMRSVARHLSRPLSYLIPLFVFDLLLPVLQVSRVLMKRIGHAVEIALIITFAWTLIQLVKVIQDLVRHRININQADNLRQRQIITRLMYVRRVINTIIVLLSIGAVLLTFDKMRKIGAGLLTGVGIGGIIIGFAAQRSLGNLLAGFQIAFTQPIRIDDEVIVENEFGKIEEISLTYVVVRIWDNRRMILPINYFIERPFQNWTRITSDITGVVLFYADFSLPVDRIRQVFMDLVKDHPLWDKNHAGLVVTKFTEEVMELRATVSTRSSGASWDLCCYLREELIKHIKDNYPECLPRKRAEIENGFPSVENRIPENKAV